MRVHKDDTIAVVIDIQELLFPYIHENEKLETNNIKLIRGLNELGIPIIVTQQYTKGLLPTIKSISDVITDSDPIEKMSFSCCGEPKFNESLALSGKRNIIITGIESHVCVLQTVVDLIENGYNPVVIEDCISSRNPNDKKIAIDRMRAEGATVTTYESILFELLKVSGGDTFKSISKIVK